MPLLSTLLYDDLTSNDFMQNTDGSNTVTKQSDNYITCKAVDSIRHTK